MTQSKTKLTSFFISTLFLIGLIIYIFHINILVSVIKSSDLESYEHNVAIKLLFRSYKLFGDKVSKKIIKEGNVSRSDNLLRVIGVIGDIQSVNYLQKTVIKYSKQKLQTDNFYYIASIRSLSLASNKKSVDMLEQILSDRHTKENKLSGIYFSINWCVARSLYILTGDRYLYDGSSGKNVKVPITRGLQTIRNVVNETAETTRDYDQMVTLYKLVLPVKKDKEFYGIVLE